MVNLKPIYKQEASLCKVGPKCWELDVHLNVYMHMCICILYVAHNHRKDITSHTHKEYKKED